MNSSDRGTSRQHVWEDVIDEVTAQVYLRYAGARPITGPAAILQIDNYNAVFGDRPQPILEAIEEFPTTCGFAAWDAVAPTRRLLDAAREQHLPIVHTGGPSVVRASEDRSATRRTVFGKRDSWRREIFAALAPLDNEVLLAKRMASAFFGTDLCAMLRDWEVDEVVVCGNTTSGCVRATAVDAYNNGFQVTIVEECVFDRSPLSHKVNLFDLNAKYTSVRFLDNVLEELHALPVRGTQDLVQH